MPSGNNNSLNQLQQQQQAALTQGGAAIQKNFASKFTPQFFQGVQTSYENAELPQLFDSYRQTAQNLNYKTADQGIQKSSAAQNLGSSLNKQLAQGEQQVVNQGQGAAQSVQQQAASEESQLYGQLQSSQNPTQIGQSAANLAAQTAAPSTFAPIGNLFSNWSNMFLANQTADNANQSNQLALALYSPYLNQATSTGGGAAAPNY
jgi:hypothetical protein